MSSQIAPVVDQSAIEQVVIGGDLSKLTPMQRVTYYKAVCNSLGLNPLTKPFSYLTLSGKLTLYANKDAAEQLRKLNGISITKLERETIGDVHTVTAYAIDKDGRQDASTGAVSIAGLRGVDLSNALMKTETKAKRRVTLSICGLGMLDETELESVRDAAPVVVNDTGEIIQGETVVSSDDVHQPVLIRKEPASTGFRPYQPEVLKAHLDKRTQANEGKAASDKQRGLLHGMLDALTIGSKEEYDALLAFLFDVETSKELSDAQVIAALDWVKPIKDSGGAFMPDPVAQKEANLVLEGLGFGAATEDDQ